MRAFLLGVCVLLALTIANYFYAKGRVAPVNPYGSGESVMGSIAQAAQYDRNRRQQAQDFWLRELGAAVLAAGAGYVFAVSSIQERK